MSDQTILFSIHAWVQDEAHDVLLGQALPEWKIDAIARTPFDSDLTPRQHLNRWVHAAATSITETQPTGPLHVIGWSIGGRMAYEISNHLRERGRTIAYCGVIDTLGEWPSLRPSRIRRLIDLVRGAATISSKWNVIRRGPISRIKSRVILGFMLCIPPSYRASRHSANREGKYARFLDMALKDYLKLSLVYRHKQSTIPLSLFVTQPSVALYQSPDLYWSLIVGESVAIYPVAGKHATVFDGENLDSLTRAIEQSLPAVSER
jgi:thioesterase domain-containing protein